MKQLPWPQSDYLKLDPSDFSPTPAPTPEQRIRVAAALATRMRDLNMLGLSTALNAEAIRAVLVMDESAWARDIAGIGAIAERYDPVDPKTRFEQVQRAFR